MTRAALLALLLATMPVASAQSWDRAPEQIGTAPMTGINAYHTRVADTLATADSPRDRALAQLLRTLDPVSGTQRTTASDTHDLRSLVDAAGNDRLALQMLVMAANNPASGTRAVAVSKWQTLEPDNLMPQLYLGLPDETLLTRSRQAGEASAHMYELARWILGTYHRHPLTADELNAIGISGDPQDLTAAMALAAWASIAMPQHGLVEACSRPALQRMPDRAPDCRHAGALLADHSESTREQILGLLILRDQAGTDDARAALDTRRRRIDWLMQQWGMRQANDGPISFARMLQDSEIHSELQLFERTLEQAGVPLQPPADWQAY